MTDKQIKADMEELCRLPAFLRFLDRAAIQSAEIFGSMAATTDGAATRNLFNEGRRHLGLEILRDAARGMPVSSDEAAFNLLLINVLREAAQAKPEEPHRGRRSRYDDPDRDDGSDADAGG